VKATDLSAFLKGELSGSDLQKLIAPEAGVWAASLRERGRSAPITLIGGFPSLDVTRNRALRLMDALLTSELSPVSVAYVLNALLISEDVRWTNPTVRNNIEQLVIPDTGAIEMREAWKVRDQLSAPKAD
jgi:hypothetical protein